MIESKIALYDALIAAFCLVAYSDGEVHPTEITDVMYFLKSKNIETDIVKVQSDINDMIEHMERNYDAAKQKAFAKLIQIKADDIACGTLLEIMQSAIVADQKLSYAEEGVMEEILNYLDIKES